MVGTNILKQVSNTSLLLQRYRRGKKKAKIAERSEIVEAAPRSDM